MWMDAERDEEELDDADAPNDDVWDLSDHGAYWRRRFLLLCAGVIALGVCAWLFPGARHAPGRTSAAARASMAALATRQSLPAAAYGPAWSSPAPSVSPSGSPGASPTNSANFAAKTKKIQKISTAYHPRPTVSPTASPAGGTAGAKCAPADIVLSLFSSQPSYDRAARPRFSVYAVSTAAAPCTLAYGAGSVQVIVTSHGHVVWDSAACAPPAAKPVRFTLGVPQLLTVTWNRKAAKPAGCAGSLPAGATGTLQAVAMSHGESSPVRAFKLRLSAEGGLERLAHVCHLGDLHR
jgi:hypothetical protein